MLNKTMNASKKIILLRSFSLLCVLAVFLSCIVFPAGAEPLNYRDYETGVTVDGSNDIVHVSFPVDTTFFEIWNDDELIKSSSGSSFSFDPLITHVYYLHLSLVNDGISLDNIPSGATISYTLNFEGWGTQMETPRIWKGLYFYDSNHVQSYVGEYVDLPYDLFPQATYTYSYILPSTNNSYFKPGLAVYGLVARDSYSGPYNISVLSISIDFTISSLYRLQEQTGETNELLDEVNRQLAEQGKTMEDILNQQEQTNDKLDQLPGQIGDHMQGVIESEKEESKSEGNKFVDQILDALPDPSTDVLAALKSLTDATAYTGTDAVLPIPSIVLPGIDGLFPETEIWGGTQFDFGEYLNLLPPTLLTLVQSLFTIAIVLYCVYELKGIISFVFTLNELHKGDWE